MNRLFIGNHVVVVILIAFFRLHFRKSILFHVEVKVLVICSVFETAVVKVIIRILLRQKFLA